MTALLQERIAEALKPLLSDDALGWLTASRREIAETDSPLPALERVFPAVRRVLGTRSAGRSDPVEANHATISLQGWQACDLGRALLLIDASARMPSLELVETLFRNGDESERSAIVRTLILLPEAEKLKSIALEAGRTNSVALFATLALDNAYPDRQYSEHEFNQVVLKALFMGLPIGRMAGLEQRANPDLARMCEDFYDERTAAGRPAPCDIWLAMTPHASARALDLAIDHLGHSDPEHRLNAAIAIGRRASSEPELRSKLQRRLEIEADERVLRALRAFGWKH